MPIVLPRPIARELSGYTQSIINLILDCQTQLTRQDILGYFRNNPDLASDLLTQAQEKVKTFPIVLKGLKEKIDSAVLPEIGELDHSAGWLEEGDIFVGFSGSCHTYPYDRPYVVTLDGDEGYEWRYIDEPADNSRPPMKLDPGLRLYAWWKVPIGDEANAAEEIKTFLTAEIAALTEYVDYLKNFSISG